MCDVHRRNRRRRRPRPQRTAPRTLVADARRTGHPRFGIRRPRRPGRRRGLQGAPRTGSDVPRRHRAGTDHSRRGDQGRSHAFGALRRVAARGTPRHRHAPAAPRLQAQPRHGRPTSGVLRLHRRRPARLADPDGGVGLRTARFDGHRHARRRDVAAFAVALRLLRRAVRAGHQPATRCDPRGNRHLDGACDGTRAEPARPDRGVVSTDHAALAGHRQRRSRQARPHQRRRRQPGTLREGPPRTL